MILLLVGCMGQLWTPDGTEALRSALIGVQDEITWILLTNSTVDCAPETTENDPQTPYDDAANAQIWWNQQLSTAFGREGAWVVMLALHGEPEGLHPISAAGWSDESTAAGAWVHIKESAVIEQQGIFITYDGIDVGHGLVDSPAWVEVDPSGVDGRFTFTNEGIAGTFHAERCESPLLYGWLFSQLISVRNEDRTTY